MKEEIAFFHAIVPRILALVAKDFGGKFNYHYKKGDVEKLNLATDTDVKVEELIIDELNKRFPQDRILSEETYPNETNLEKGRIWIIDPICGTICFARGITTFTTNIALSLDGKPIAACVVDYSQGQYFWSVGKRAIYMNTYPYVFERTVISQPIIELNLGAVRYWNKKIRVKYSSFISRLMEETDFILMSQLTSLSFAYVALGRIDAYVSPYHHLWDVPAINFLIEQSGGVVSDLSGKPWVLTSTNTLAARNKNLHRQLLTLLQT